MDSVSCCNTIFCLSTFKCLYVFRVHASGVVNDFLIYNYYFEPLANFGHGVFVQCVFAILVIEILSLAN